MNEDRKRTRFTPVHALFAAAILGLAVTPLAGAGADERDATAAAVSNSKFKKLKKRVGALADQVDALAQQPGPAGPQGAPGSGGATNVVVRTDTRTVTPGATTTFLGRSCDPGERATGGGIGFEGLAAGDSVAGSVPTLGGLPASDGQTADGWLGAIRNGSDLFTRAATTFVICASP